MNENVEIQIKYENEGMTVNCAGESTKGTLLHALMIGTADIVRTVMEIEGLTDAENRRVAEAFGETAGKYLYDALTGKDGKEKITVKGEAARMMREKMQ